MGKVFDKRAALGNHQRQRAQATMMLHGWRAFVNNYLIIGVGAINEGVSQMIAKDVTTGRAAIYRMPAPLIAPSQFIEWDDVSTPRVLWLYKVMLR